jgi:hypothetical protein
MIFQIMMMSYEASPYLMRQPCHHAVILHMWLRNPVSVTCSVWIKDGDLSGYDYLHLYFRSMEYSSICLHACLFLSAPVCTTEYPLRILFRYGRETPFRDTWAGLTDTYTVHASMIFKSKNILLDHKSERGSNHQKFPTYSYKNAWSDSVRCDGY